MRRLKRLALLLTLLGPLTAMASAAMAPAAMAQGRTEVRIAENVYVVPDKNAEAITGWLIVKAGCADEAYGDCRGLAHYLEHLLLVGRRPDHTTSSFSLFPEGVANGWTSHRTTTYFQRFPVKGAEDAERVDKLLAYFMRLVAELKIADDAADRERNVVLQEYNVNTGRNPFARFSIELEKSLLPDEALGQRVIGSPSTIKGFTVAAAADFHRHWYTKGNIAIVLHGPIDPAVIRPIAERHLASLPDRPNPPARYALISRPYPHAITKLRHSDPEAKQTGVYVYRVTGFAEIDRRQVAAARRIVNAFLASKLPGSPNDLLIDKQGLALTIGIGSTKVRDGVSRLSISGQPVAGIAPDKLAEAALAYVEGLAGSGLSAEIIERLKTRLAVGQDLVDKQPAELAGSLVGWLSNHLSYDDWLWRRTALEQVTPQSVQLVLQTHAARGRTVVGIITPPSAAATPTATPGPSAPAAPAPTKAKP